MSDLDHRYKYVRSIWIAGDLKSFAEIFSIIPRSIVATDLHLNYDRFTKKVSKPEMLTYRDIRNLSRLTGIDFKSLSELVVGDIERKTLLNAGA
jgi:hypothetical protein